MDIKNLLILLLKVLGVYVFITIVLSLPEMFAAIFFVLKEANFTYFSFFLFFLVIRLVISWGLCMRTTTIANYLMKEEESSEKVNISMLSVITIAVIMAGLWLAVNELPTLINQLTDKFFNPQFDHRSFYLLASLVKFGIGVWMVFCHKWIATQINKQA